MDEAAREWLKTAGAAGGAFIGALLVRVGRKWKRLMSDRDDAPREGRLITRDEWHDLRDTVHKAVWEIANFKLYLERELGRMEQLVSKNSERLTGAHDRIGNVMTEVTLLKERLENLEEQLDRLSDRFQPRTESRG